jgi:hypothetical protein
MATRLHLATVGFSVRNVLALQGAMAVGPIAEHLRARWNPHLDTEEVQKSLDKMLEVGLVRKAFRDTFEAVAPMPFDARQRPDNEVWTDDEPKAWSNWHKVEN